MDGVEKIGIGVTVLALLAMIGIYTAAATMPGFALTLYPLVGIVMLLVTAATAASVVIDRRSMKRRVHRVRRSGSP